MIVGSIKEDLSLERRVALTPEAAKNIIALGLKVCIEKNYANHIGISDDNFNRLTSLSRNYSAFDLLDSFFSNDKAEVSKVLNSLIDSGLNINEMIGLINSELHKIFEIKFLLQEKSLNKNQIQDKTGIKSSYYFEKMLKTANLITLNRAFLIQKKLLDFDLRSKTTSFNQELEFELLLLLNQLYET